MEMKVGRCMTVGRADGRARSTGKNPVAGRKFFDRWKQGKWRKGSGFVPFRRPDP